MLSPLLAELAAGLGSVALFTFAGVGWVELLGLRRLPFAARLGYAYLLGVAWVAGGLYAGSHLFELPLNRTSTLVLAGLPVLAGLAAFLFRRRSARSSGFRWNPRTGDWLRGAPEGARPQVPTESGASPRPRGRRRRRPPLAVILAIVLGSAVTLGLLVEALASPLTDWDGRMTWASQARYLRAAGTVDAPALQKDRWYITHPQYPVLLPVAQVAVLEVFNAGEDEQPFRPLYAAFFPAFLVILFDGARRLAGRRAAGWAVLAAAVAPFLAAGEGGAAGGYSDLPLSCFYGAALLLLLRPRSGWRDGIAAGLLLGAAVLTKNEGSLLAGFALAAGGWAMLRLLPRGRQGGLASRRALRRRTALALAALFVVAATLLFFAWRSHIPNRHDEGYEKFGLAALWPAVFTRIPMLLPPVFSCFFNWEHWTILWWTVPVVFVAGRRGFKRRVTLPLALAWLAPLAVAWGAYSVHTQPLYLVTVTWDRMLIQGAIPFFLLLSLALRQIGSALRGVKTK